jgi:zinc/manganese transport system substrate-binding protein
MTSSGSCQGTLHVSGQTKVAGRPSGAVLTLLLALIVAAGPAISQPADRVAVVASFSILADLIHEVGGGHVDVVTLVGAGGDAHVYSPTPADAKKLAAAKLVVINGLGFEGWMERLVKASATEARIVVASRGVAPRRTSGLAHGAGGIDPHAWQSVDNVEIYVGNIRDALVGIDPAWRAAYEESTAAYLRRLSTLNGDVRGSIATIPPERRKVITTHDAFGYFGAAYGVEFLALEGVSTETEASARDVARIISVIRQQHVPAIFFENVTDPRLVKRIAAETGARIGGTLYSDALTGPAGPAPTYIDLMRHNLEELVAALK